MKRRNLILSLVSASLGLSVLNVVGGPLGYGKAGKNTFIPAPPLPQPQVNRFGVNATGGMGFKAEFFADAFIKYHPHVPTHQLCETDDEEFAPGVEVFYERVMSEQNEHLWGLRAGLGYTRVEAEADWTTSTGGFLETELDANIVYVTAGPFYEHRFTDRFYAQMSAGLSVAYVDADLHAEVPGSGFSDSSSESDFLIGAYVAAAIGYDVTPNWGLMTGIRYQYMDRFQISNDLVSSSLDADGAYQVFVGVRWTF